MTLYLALFLLYTIYCVWYQENRADKLEIELEEAKEELEELKAILKDAGISPD